MDSFISVIEKPEAFATLLAACIGVIGLSITFLVTFWKTKAFQRSEKIAEARLDIYLNLVEKYSEFIISLHVNIGSYIGTPIPSPILEAFLNFVVAFNKACTVCTSKTKQELDSGFKEIKALYIQILQPNIDLVEKNKKILQIEKRSVELSLFLREEIDVLDNKKLEVKIISDNFT